MTQKVVWVAALALSGLAAATTATQGPERALSLRMNRFYAPGSGSTTIEGVCEVSLPALFAGARQGGGTRYRFEVRVLDSAGLELLRNEWSRDVPAGAAQSRGASVVETFSFATAPGRFRVRIRAIPDGAGTPAEQDTELVAYERRPMMSDLLLAGAVRRPATDSEALAPGEIRRAGLAMRTAPLPRLSPAEAMISYYAELYPRGAADSSGELQAAVIGGGQAERVIVRTPARHIAIGAGGAVSRGSLDLAGLPEGSYRLRLTVQLRDTTLVREAGFAMSGLAALAQTAPPAAAADLFEAADESRLDSLFGPLVHLSEAAELGPYGTLTVEGKRRFLREFWRRRDPTPNDAANHLMAEFYRGVAYVNEAFREGGAAQVPGWRTDRGRVYLRNGRWDEILQRPSASPRPYEVWKYTRERNRYYVFYDQSGFGHYGLLATNDRREQGRPNWLNTLGRENADDVVRFLGISSPEP